MLKPVNPKRFQSHWMHEKYGIPDPDNVLIILDDRSDNTSQDRYDESGNEYDFQQVTGGAQPEEIASSTNPVQVWDYDGDDYRQLKEIDDETGMTFWPTNAGHATVAGGALLRVAGVDLAALYATESGNSKYRGVLYDSGGDPISWWYIRGADSALAVGASLFDAGKGDYDDGGGGDTESWGAQGTNTVDTQDLGGGNFALRITGDGSSAAGAKLTLKDAADLSEDLVIGQLYQVTYKRKVGVGDSVRFRMDPSAGTTITFETVENTTLATGGPFYFIASSVDADGFILGGLGNGEILWIDDLVIKKVTSFGTDGVKLANTVAGGTQNVTGTGAGDPNDPSTLEIYKVLGANNLTSDFSIIIVHKPDDGRPASNKYMFSWYSDGGDYGIAFILTTAGKLLAYLSDDGATKKGIETDSAVYANGSQSKYSVDMLVYDNAGTGIIYHDGAEAASSNLGAGGPGTAIYDTYHPVIIGAEATPGHYADMYGGTVIIINSTITAAQVKTIYEKIKNKYGI